MAVFLLAAVDRKNPERYQAYEEGAFASVVKYGVQPLAVSDNIRVLEGTAPAGRIVLLKFETQEALDAWYNSPEYQGVIPIRQAHADTPFVVTFEGL
jgi:uncharacterized protein (DUF1330 family)